MKRTQILSTATALLFVATAAQAQRRQDDHHGQGQRGQAPPQVQPHAREGNPGRGVAQVPQRPFDQGRPGEARGGERDNHEIQTRQRQQMADVDRARQLEERDRVLEAQRRAELDRAHYPDRVYRPGYQYRYLIGGVYRETNQYGADILRQAVNLGYQRGYDAGLVDLRNGASPDYRLAFDYQAGNYGFTPDYIPESDYSYYFREGFQRGYDDAYWNRAQYGTYYNGTASILGNVMAGILGLTTIN